MWVSLYREKHGFTFKHLVKNRDTKKFLIISNFICKKVDFFIFFYVSIIFSYSSYKQNLIDLVCYGNQFVTQYITYLNIWEALQGPGPHCQTMTDWFWFELHIGADLLPSTGCKMNFLIKWSACRISKFIMRSLFFCYNL